ncbi:SRPBCC domain-containing protein [Actinoallomurus sp. CA-150999]|uniref:SRPBCC family protein n=1 Tax=Actinoallomurus sp. CA-150999 TaxID=3239887 RepID=UPI003D94E27A
MELDHEFTVPVPVEQAWQVLLDVERIAPCMPGAALDAAEADEFTGRLKVRLGAMTITYRGTARISSRDDEAHTVTIEASGKEARGSGTAAATVQATLHEEDGHTRVAVHTKLNVTGRPAQFGRGILAEVGGKLIGRFADNLATELASEQPAAAETAGETAAGTPTASEAAAPAEARIEAETSTAATTEDAVPAQPATSAPAETPAGTPQPAAADAPAETAPSTPEQATAETAPGAPERAAGDAQAEAATGAPERAAAETAPGAPEETATGNGAGVPAKSAAKAARAPEKATTSKPVGAPAARPEAEPINLLEVAGPSVAKRVVPLVAGLALLLILWRLIRRSGER